MAEKIILGGLTALALFGGGISHGSREDSRAIMTSGQPEAGHARGAQAPGPQRIRRDLDGLFRTTVTIDGHAVSMIIDTGASRTILARQTAAEIGALERSGEVAGRIRTLSGVQSFETARVRHIRVGTRTIADHQMAIMETPGATSVIGQDLLSELGPITFDGDSVAIP